MSAARVIDESEIGITWVMDEPMARSSHALVDGGKVWLIDPVKEHDALARVAELGEPAAVFQLLDRHNRDCQEVAEDLGVPLVKLPDELKSTPFKSIRVVKNRLWHEIALWWQAKGVLVVPEAIGTSPFYKPSLSGAGVHLMLRATPPKRQLGTYLPEHLLVGHGEAIHGPNATDALQEALDRSRRDIPGALIGALRALLSK